MSLMSDVKQPKRKRKTLKKLHFNQALNITQNQTTGLLTTFYPCVVHVISMDAHTCIAAPLYAIACSTPGRISSGYVLTTKQAL